MHRVLGETSVYRVVGEDGEIVIAEALDVPGTARGEIVRLTRAAVEAMELVDEQPASAKRIKRPGRSADAA